MNADDEHQGGDSIWDQAESYPVIKPLDEHKTTKRAVAGLVLLVLIAAVVWWVRWEPAPLNVWEPEVDTLVDAGQPAPLPAPKLAADRQRQAIEMPWLLGKKYPPPNAVPASPAVSQHLPGMEDNKLPGLLALAWELSQPDTWLLKGELELARGAHTQALDAFENVLKLGPNDVRAQAGRIRVLLDTGQIEAAGEFINVLAEQFPDDPGGAYLRALYAKQLGDNEAVLQLLEIVFSYEHDNALSLLLLGQVQLAMGNFEQALLNLGRFHRMQPGSRVGRRYLGEAYLDNGEPERAIKLLKPLVGTLRDDPEIASLLVTAYLELNKKRRARLAEGQDLAREPNSTDYGIGTAADQMGGVASNAGFGMAFQAASESIESRVLVAQSYLRLGQAEEAFALSQALLADRPQNARLLYLHSSVMALQGNSAAARDYLKQARALDSGFNFADLALPAVAGLRRTTTESVRRLEDDRQQDANALKPRLLLADFYLQQRDADKALLLGNEILQLAPAHVVGNYLRASALLLAGEAVAGVQLLEQLEKSHSDNLALKWRLVEAYERLGNEAAQQATLWRILGLDERNAQALLNVALGLRRDGNRQSAYGMVERLKQQHPIVSVGYLVEAQLAADEGAHRDAAELLKQAFQLAGDAHSVARWSMALRRPGQKSLVQHPVLDWLADDWGENAGTGAVARVSERNKSLRREIEQYQWLSEREPANIPVLMLLAQAYRAVGDGRALAMAQRAFELDDTDIDVMDLYAVLLVDSGMAARGVEIMREVVRQAPDNGSFHYHLALALQGSDELDEAVSVLKELLTAEIEFDENTAARILLNQLQISQKR